MIRKIGKYALWILAILFGLVLLLVVAVYLPPVQNFIKGRAVAYVSENFGMELSIERLRLRFPLRLAVDDAQAVTSAGDTLFRCGRLRADVALWPLVGGEVVVREFTFDDASFRLADSVTGMDLDIRVREFGLTADAVTLGAQTAHLEEVRLIGGDVRLRPGEARPDTAATDTASAPLLWRITADRLQLDDIAFRMQSDTTDLWAGVGSGVIDSAGVDLSDLTIRAARLRLSEGGFGYGQTDRPPKAGFDPQRIEIQELEVAIDSVFNRGTTVRAVLRELAFVERSGLAVRQARGIVAMDSTGYTLSGFRLKTAASELQAEARVGSGITAMEPATPIRVTLAATVGTEDLFRLTEPDERMSRHLVRRKLSIETRLTGILDALKLKRLHLSLPDELDFDASGEVRAVTTPARTAGKLSFEGGLGRSPWVASLLPAGIVLPPLTLRGEAEAVKGEYRGSLHLRTVEGSMAAQGSFRADDQHYTADLQVDSLALFRFLPADSLGYVTLTARAEGQGFDPYAPTTAGQVDLRIAQAEYKGFDYRAIALTAELAESRLIGRLTSDNEGLGADLSLHGLLTAQRQEASVAGLLSRLDLERLRLTPTPASASGRIALQASATDSGSYAARVELDSLQIRYGTFTNSVARTVLSAEASPHRVMAEAASGDLRLTFRSAVGIDSLVAGFDRTVAQIQHQIQVGDIDADTLSRLLPPFRMEFRAARNNLLYSFLRAREMGFGQAKLTAHAGPEEPFDFRAEVNRFSTQGLVLDTLTAGVGNREGALRYFARLANRAGNRNRIGLIALSGHAAGRSAQLSLAQRDCQGRQGVNFGLRATLADSSVTVNLLPQRPVFGFAEWTVNDGNYVRYGFPDRTLEADLRVERAGQSFTLQSIEAEDLPSGSLRLGIAGIDIGGVLRLLPQAPPVGGRLGADLAFGLADSLLAARGGVTVDTLRYDGRRVGDIGLQVAYRTDTKTVHSGSLTLTVDHRTALTVDGRYVPASPADSIAGYEAQFHLAADLPGIPLRLANAFLPEGSGTLAGRLRGHIEANGTPRQPLRQLEGTLNFDSTSVDVAAIGTRFRVTDTPIRLEAGRVLFRDFGLIAPNRQPLTLNGYLDLRELEHITADLRAAAQDFQLVNVPRNRGSMVFGEASADLSARVRGPIDALEIRGNAELLAGTEVTYVMQETTLGIKDESQTVVRFVAFNDTTTVHDSRPPAMLRLGGIDMLMNVAIDPQVRVSVYLSTDGQNRIDLQGGGNLTYSMNRLGDTRFAGRYELSGGRVRYSPPVISTKNFTISPGGYVNWTGEIADPTFAVRASETVRTTVTMEDQSDRQVEFRIGIDLSGSLQALDVRFDLSAPEDLTLQNQLASLTPEQRQNQAMSLLIYNTYSGPGTSAKVNTGNPLNSFITKELNQWAQNSLPGVDLSFGIDSYDDPAAGPDGTRTDYSYKLSKRFFDNRVRVSVGGKVSSGGDPAQNAAENLVGDISLEYQLSRRDNMYLKAFRETDFESILEGEVTETGVGFGVRKKVSKLGDLFRLTKEKKEVKEARRAHRQEQRAERRLERLNGQTTAPARK